MAFNNADIPEADYFTPYMLEETYVDMEIEFPKYGEGPNFAKVRKRMRDANGIPIGRHHDNPMLGPRVYEVEYLDVHKASLSENYIAENLFS